MKTNRPPKRAFESILLVFLVFSFVLGACTAPAGSASQNANSTDTRFSTQAETVAPSLLNSTPEPSPTLTLASLPPTPTPDTGLRTGMFDFREKVCVIMDNGVTTCDLIPKVVRLFKYLDKLYNPFAELVEYDLKDSQMFNGENYVRIVGMNQLDTLSNSGKKLYYAPLSKIIPLDEENKAYLKWREILDGRAIKTETYNEEQYNPYNPYESVQPYDLYVEFGDGRDRQFYVYVIRIQNPADFKITEETYCGKHYAYTEILMNVNGHIYKHGLALNVIEDMNRPKDFFLAKDNDFDAKWSQMLDKKSYLSQEGPKYDYYLNHPSEREKDYKNIFVYDLFAFSFVVSFDENGHTYFNRAAYSAAMDPEYISGALEAASCLPDGYYDEWFNSGGEKYSIFFPVYSPATAYFHNLIDTEPWTDDPEYRNILSDEEVEKIEQLIELVDNNSNQ